MAADEPAVRPECRDHVTLHRADVRDCAIVANGIERLGREPRQGGDRSGAEDQLGALDGRGDAVVPGVDRPELRRPIEQLFVGIEPSHLGGEPGAGGEPDRPADQPDAEDGDLHGQMTGAAALCGWGRP